MLIWCCLYQFSVRSYDMDYASFNFFLCIRMRLYNNSIEVLFFKICAKMQWFKLWICLRNLLVIKWRLKICLLHWCRHNCLWLINFFTVLPKYFSTADILLPFVGILGTRRSPSLLAAVQRFSRINGTRLCPMMSLFDFVIMFCQHRHAGFVVILLPSGEQSVVMSVSVCLR